MSLFQLPPETLFQIFDLVGSSYFRSDLSRLTVCKQWSLFARTTCFHDFYVTSKTLRRLLSSPYVQKSLPLVQDSVKLVDVRLTGLRDWSPAPPPQDAPQTADNRNVKSSITSRGREARGARMKELDKDLVRLAAMIKHSPKLRTLRIQAASERSAVQIPRPDYLFLPTIHAFLSTATNLTSLELDLSGSQLRPHPDQEEHSEGLHMCTRIAALLTTLRRLRLRLRTICPDVLKPTQHHGTKLRLTELLINLSLYHEAPHYHTTKNGHATCCGSPSGGFPQLSADLERQAHVLAAQMTAPKCVRVLTHDVPFMTMRAFDVLTGQNVVLHEKAEWDDDGIVIEGELEDQEARYHASRSWTPIA